MASRTILGPGRTMLLIPYIDMANHEEGSSHMLRFEMGDPANKRLVLMAGRDVKAGEEVSAGGGGLVQARRLSHPGLSYICLAHLFVTSPGLCPSQTGRGTEGQGAHSSICNALCTLLQVAIEYGALRSDEALLHYGFLLHSRGGHMPLAAVDHAHWDPTDQPGKTEYPDYVAGKHYHSASCQGFCCL